MLTSAIVYYHLGIEYLQIPCHLQYQGTQYNQLQLFSYHSNQSLPHNNKGLVAFRSSLLSIEQISWIRRTLIVSVLLNSHMHVNIVETPKPKNTVTENHDQTCGTAHHSVTL